MDEKAAIHKTNAESPVVAPPNDGLNGELSAFERKTIRYTRCGLLIAAASLLAALIAAWVFYGQLKEMNSQTDLLGIAAEQARIEAKNSAVSTAIQLHIMQQQLTQQRNSTELDQRAWVGLVGVFGDFKVGDHFTAIAYIRNTGKTPAIDVRMRTRLEGHRTDFMPSFAALHPVKTTAVLYPDAMAEGYGGSGAVNTLSTINELQYISLHQYVWGRVDYEDVFHHSHWMTFCMKLDNRNLRYTWCKHGNNIDTENSPSVRQTAKK